MSRSSEKIFREMQKLMEQNEFESEEQANAALQELIAQYNESLNSNIDREPERRGIILIWQSMLRQKKKP